MTDETQGQTGSAEESKKDTVRINLPPNLAGRTASPVGPSPTVKLRPTPPPTAAPEEEAKKETAVMGMPAAVPVAKKDTSRVAIPAAKPAVPEMPRPTVRLKREEGAAPPVAPTAATAPAPVAPVRPMPAMATATSGLDIGLAIAALVLMLGLGGYLCSIAFTHLDPFVKY